MSFDLVNALKIEVVIAECISICISIYTQLLLLIESTRSLSGSCTSHLLACFLNGDRALASQSASDLPSETSDYSLATVNFWHSYHCPNFHYYILLIYVSYLWASMVTTTTDTIKCCHQTVNRLKAVLKHP